MSFLSTWLPFGSVRAAGGDRRRALEQGPIETIDALERAATFLGHQRESEGALPVVTAQLDGAVSSCRGRGYARYDEDAAALFADARGWLHGVVLDQAGGLGGHVRGEASALGAKLVAEAQRAIARAGIDDADELRARLEDTYRQIHARLLARAQGEVVTCVTAIVADDRAHLVVTGDSAAMAFDAEGRIKDHTVLQEAGPPNAGCLAHALGLVPEGLKIDHYTWALAPGDWLVLASDGLLDAGLEHTEIGALLAEGKSAEEAANRLATTVLRRMSTFRAKPDNLTLLLVRRAGGAAPKATRG